MNKQKKIILAMLVLVVIFLIVEVSLHLWGDPALTEEEVRKKNNIRQAGAFRIICIGEAITASGGNESYPRILEGLLNKEKIGLNFKVDNLGVYADSAICLIRLEDVLGRYRPDMVIAMMGINDGQEISIYKYIPSLRPAALRFIRQLRIYRLVNFLVEKLLADVRQGESLIIPADHKLTIEDDYQDKEKEYKRLLELNPENYAACIDLGRLYRQNLKYRQAEEILKQAIEINPQRDWAFLELGWCYSQQGKYDQAEEMLKKAIQINPRNPWSYTELIWWYGINGEYVKGRQVYKESIELYTDKYLRYINLVRWHFVRGEYSLAEEVLKEVLKLYPKKYRIYIGLGQCYNLQSKYSSAEEILKQAIEINPQRDWAFLELGWCYNQQGKYDQAEEMLKKALKINPLNRHIFMQLAHCYEAQNNFKQAKSMLERAIELNPRDDKAYAAIAIFYKEQGDIGQALKYEKIAQDLRLEYYNTQTVNNYDRLHKMLKQLDIKLVCVQYPLRSIVPLKRIFQDQEEIIFVDNKSIFKAAVESETYYDYFLDKFAGDFGHPTPKGNRLLAENISQVILREYFNDR